MRIGIRLAVSGLVLASIIISAIGVHVLWWRTAEANTRPAADYHQRQIVSAVEKELAIITPRRARRTPRSAPCSCRTCSRPARPTSASSCSCRSCSRSRTISWVAFGWPDGAFFAAHKLGDLGLEMMEIALVDGSVKRRVDQYRGRASATSSSRSAASKTPITSSPIRNGIETGIKADEPRWFNVIDHPIGPRPSIAYAGPVDVYQKRQGVLAVIIEYTRLAQFLSQLSVGKSGRRVHPRPRRQHRSPRRIRRPTRLQHAAVGSAVAADRAERAQAGRQSDDSDKRRARAVRLVAGGDAYAVTLTPLAFPGWTLATVIPEAEFLGPVERTIRQLLDWPRHRSILAAGLLSAWLARRVVAAPLITVVGRTQARRALRAGPGAAARLAPRPKSRTCRMPSPTWPAGLAAFRKYILPIW